MKTLHDLPLVNPCQIEEMNIKHDSSFIYEDREEALKKYKLKLYEYIIACHNISILRCKAYIFAIKEGICTSNLKSPDCPINESYKNLWKQCGQIDLPYDGLDIVDSNNYYAIVHIGDELFQPFICDSCQERWKNIQEMQRRERENDEEEYQAILEMEKENLEHSDGDSSQ
jgi:hypothetical protein